MGKDVFSWFTGLYLERGMDAILMFQHSHTTAPQIIAGLPSIAKSWFKAGLGRLFQCKSYF